MNLTKERRKEFLFYKRSHIRNLTDEERQFRDILDKRGIRYMLQKGFLLSEENFIIVDFYIPKPFKYVFEIDGKYHTNQRVKFYDESKDKFLRSKCIVPYRITHEDLKDLTKLGVLLDFLFKK